MFGLDICVRAITGVLANIKQALLISGFWWVVTTIFGLSMLLANPAMEVEPGTVMTPEQMEGMGLFAFIAFVGGILTIIGFLTIAIGWHRHLLMGEKRSSLLIWPSGYRRWGYFWRLIVIFLIAAPVLFIAMFAFGGFSQDIERLASTSYQILMVLPLIFMTLVMALFGLILPAIAVNQPMKFRQSLYLTIPRFPQILIVVFIIAAIAFIPSLIFGTVFGRAIPGQQITASIIVGLILTYVVNWFSTLVSVGYLSELYRSLVDEAGLNPTQAQVFE